MRSRKPNAKKTPANAGVDDEPGPLLRPALRVRRLRAAPTALDGSCRTFMSVWCGKLGRHVTKNAPCEARFGRRRPTTGF